MKKILIISESIDVDDSSGSKVNVALIENLHQLGYSLKVLHYTQKPIVLNNINCISIQEKKWTLNYILSRTQRVIQRMLKVDFSNKLENIFGNSFTFFNDSKSITSAIYKEKEAVDLIITLSKGASFRPHHAMLPLNHLHKKWLAYVHDPFPFHFYPEPFRFVDKGSNYKEVFFRKVSEKSEFSAFPSLLLKEWMGKYYPNFLKNGIIIPHQSIEETKKNVKELPPYITTKKFTVLHAGNLLKERNPKYLVDGYLAFLRLNPTAKEEAQLLFLGNASTHEHYLNSIKEATVYWSNGYVPFEQVKNIQEQVDVNVILESKSEISPFLPGKFPHCVKANKPILLIAPKLSETKRLLGEKYPYISEVTDQKKIGELLTELYTKWKAKETLELNRQDLIDYVELPYLRAQMKQILNT